MSKITLTIEDMPEGKVKIVAEPTFETMMKMINSGEKMSSAHGYALLAINEIRKESKARKPMKILVPRMEH